MYVKMVALKKAPKWCLRLLVAIILIANITGITGTVTSVSADTWYNYNWDYRKKITIDTASGGADLTNFPVLIQLTADADLGDGAQLNGDDILFTADDKITKLDHEIESYSSSGSSANLTAWVKIPTLSASVTTDIYMYYGNSGATNQENAAAVWDSNYQMVQHMEETSGGTDAITDSTANSNNGTDSGSPTFSAAGKANGAISFDGSDDRIDLGYGNTIGVTRPLTIEAWINPNSVPGLNTSDPIVFRDNNSAMNYALSVANGTSYTGGTGVKILFWREDATDADFNTYGTTTISAGNWYHVVVVDDGTQGASGNFTIYVNGGSPEGSKAVTMTAYDSASHKTVIGDNNGETIGSGHFFDGIIDEVRISNTARSAGWIATSYDNQNNPAAFITVDTEENTPTIPSVATTPATSVEETSATLNADIADTGGEDVTERGFEWSTHPSFATSSNWTESGTYGTGTYSHGITSLPQGEGYYYRAIAKNAVGWYTGNIQNFQTKPEAPTSFTATAVSSSQLNLSWTKGVGANITMIRYSTTGYPASTSDGTPIYGDTGTSYNMTGLPPATTLYFSAWSIATDGPVQYSDAYDTASGTTDATTPMAATAGYSEIEETSANISGVVGYNGGEACQYAFEWGTNTGVYTDNISWTGSLNTGDYFYTHLSGLTEGQEYFYRAMVKNSAGVGYGSEVIFVTKPLAPAGLTATTLGTDSISLSWTPGTGSDNTTITMKIGSYPTSPSDGTSVYTGPGGTHTCNSLTPGIDYYFSAWSLSSYGSFTSISDTYASDTASTDPLISPTVLTNATTDIAETSANITGTLTNNGGEDCYWILEWGTSTGVYTDNTTWSATTITTGDTYSHQLTGLSRGTKYYYRAGVKNSTDTVYGAEQELLTRPEEPSSFSAVVIGDNQIDLSWTMGDGAGRIMIRARTDHYPTSYTDGAEVYFDSGTNYSHTGLIPGTTYYYSAWSEKTGSQQWSFIPVYATGTTTGTPPPPPAAVGGKVLTVNKALILAPIFTLGIAFILVSILMYVHIRRRHYVNPGNHLLMKHFKLMTGDKQAFKKES